MYVTVDEARYLDRPEQRNEPCQPISHAGQQEFDQIRNSQQTVDTDSKESAMTNSSASNERERQTKQEDDKLNAHVNYRIPNKRRIEKIAVGHRPEAHNQTDDRGNTQWKNYQFPIRVGSVLPNSLRHNVNEAIRTPSLFDFGLDPERDMNPSSTAERQLCCIDIFANR